MNRKLASVITIGWVCVILGVNAHGESLSRAPTEWTPIASEKLIKLPAGYLDRYVEQDYQQSALAQTIDATQNEIQTNLQQIRNLKGRIASSSGSEQMQLQHSLLVAKSDYLDVLEERQRLSRQVLEKKAALYQSVLNEIMKSEQLKQEPVHARLIENQMAARERLKQSMAAVDDVLANAPDLERTQYAKQYGENLARIEELKTAINQHVANSAPVIDGKDVSRETFVRHLLAGVESDSALLDQEQLMMGYMARLVALDAQALEQKIALGDGPESGQNDSVAGARLVDAAELFIN